MRKLFLTTLCLVTLLSFGLKTSAKASTGQIPVFYVAAHPDDIQLFMGNQAAADASNASVRSVWIVVTAGNGGRSSNYWQAREAGSVASMEQALGWTPGNFPANCYQSTDRPTVNGHTVVRYKLIDASGNERSVMYCLHLTDGNVDGSGYVGNGYESLLKLINGTISTIHTVDSIATYSGISDVMNTLDTIMTNERNDTDPSIHPWLVANEYSGMRNTNDATDDHTDHRVLGSILASFAYHNGYNRCWWISYTVYTGGGYTSVTGTDLAKKESVFFAYAHAMDTMLTFFNGQTPPSGQNWTWSGSTYEIGDRAVWISEWGGFGPYMHVVTRTYSTADTGNNYPLTYP